MVEVITRAPESMFGFVSATLMSLAVLTLLPNMRLKLAGGDRFKGSGVLCAGAHELSFNRTPPCGRVARSLSAIR